MTESGEKRSSASNFTSLPSLDGAAPDGEGSSPRSSPGIYSASSASARAVASGFAAASALNANPSGTSWLRYFIIICILIFLGVNIFLFLEKPAGAKISQIYDPLLKWLGYKTDGDKAVEKLNAEQEKRETKNIKMNEKKNENKNEMKKNEKKEENQPLRKKKTLPVPMSDDDDTTMKMKKAKSKAGFCYIGEDRGFRSCIEVGEGDVCMSGDIFPTNDVCINPKLRI